MAIILLAAVLAACLCLAYVAWRQYVWSARKSLQEDEESCPYSLSDVFGDQHLINAPHQKGVRWLSEIFSRSAARYPNLTALQIPHTGEVITFAELDAMANDIAAAVSRHLTGPDQIIAVAMEQDNSDIVASHLGILRAGGAVMFLDTSLPDSLVQHMLVDASPVLILTRGPCSQFEYPVLDVRTVPNNIDTVSHPAWMDDPAQHLATIFYTSGTTGVPKGVECPHAGYVNLALSYADYFDLTPGMDATSLTSSLGYDGSISEMYSAWVRGCAVVMLTKEQIRSGPDLLPVLRDAEVTTLFCPPVLLTTLTATPEIDLPYPICRYIVPAGEAFPSALVEPWTRGRRQIINTYGPTEASTDTSRQSLRPGEPITIGSPFPNVTYVILEVDELKPLPHGQIGELCIGGVHVARGYRNLPRQTAEKFVDHPQFGRLYRTGDKCCIDARTHRVHFLGRVDTQFKVRGHRVEPQPVEDILQTKFSEIEAAVLDYQNETLVAFVSAPSIAMPGLSGHESAPAGWASSVIDRLSEQLPPASVPDRIFLVDSFVMKPVSGKIDRSCLPDLSEVLHYPVASGNTKAHAKPVVEEGLIDNDLTPPEHEQALSICRSILDAPLGWDDEFIAAGAHSIAIARLAQRLRVAGWDVSVRSLVTDCNTPRKVAMLPRRSVDARPIDTEAETAGLRKRGEGGDQALAELLPIARFTALQLLFTLFFASPGIALFLVALAFVEVGTVFTTAKLWTFIAVGCGIYLLGLALPFVTLGWVMVIKFLISGSVKKNNLPPGAYPKWSRMHLRVWCIWRLESAVLMSLATMYRSAPLMAFALRQLGAQIGSNLQCAHDAYLSGPLDLLAIEDDVSIQSGAYIQTTRWSGETLHVGPITLKSQCKVGMRAAIAPDVTIGKGSWITPFSPIVNDVGPWEMWEGAPARCVGSVVRLRRITEFCRCRLPIWQLETLNILFQVALFIILNIIPTAAILWFARGIIPAGEANLSSAYFQTAAISEIVVQLSLYAFLVSWLSVCTTSILSCLFIRLTSLSPGLHPTRGLTGALALYRLNRMNAIQTTWTWTITGQYLRALAGVRFSRLGATECDVMFNLVPDLTSADAKIFWSNGCFTNMLDYDTEALTLRQLSLPKNFFSGNNCVTEYGQFPSNFLVGVSTPANEIRYRRQMRTRLEEPVSIAGNPPIKFASASFDEENKSQKPPGFRLFLARVFLNDVFSIGVLRILEGLLFAIFYVSLMRYGVNPVLNAISSLILTEAMLVLASASVKRVLVGNEWGRDDVTPFWSWKHFAYFFAQDCYFVWCRGVIGLCAGTILANPILRLMGCRIGARTLMSEPMQASDWNAVSFGKDCVINGFLQFHTFENMMLKVKQCHIGDKCAVNFGATIMSGARITSNATLLPLSLVLKEMDLPSGNYEGSPAETLDCAPSMVLPQTIEQANLVCVSKVGRM